MGVAAAHPGRERTCLAGLALLAGAILWWRWVGYQGHNDSSYATAALEWISDFPPLATNHWALRYTLVLPTAAAIALFGPIVPALALVDLTAYLAFLAFSYFAARRWFGWPAGALLLLIGIVLPQFPVQATYANPDLLEMAFVMASFWLFLLGRERAGAWRALLASGFLAGLAFVTRETTLSLLVTYGLLFLVRPGMGRLRYLWMGLGFLAVVGAQSAYFMARTGDPLYRTRISAAHDRVDRAAKQQDAQSAGRAIDSEGVLATSPAVAPLAAVFVSQKYGLLFLLAIPAYALLRVRRLRPQPDDAPLGPVQRSVVDCMAFGALVSFLFVAVNAGILYIVPRYFMVAAAMAAVPVAVLGASWLAVGGLRRTLAVLGGLAFVTTSVALLYLENTRAVAEERILAYIAASPTPVHVDPELGRRLRYLLLAAGLQDRATTRPPTPGSLVAQAQDGFVQGCVAARDCPLHDRMLAFLPRPDWTEVARFDPPFRAIAMLGLGRSMPPDLRRKVEQPGLPAVIFRVPG